MLAMGILNYVRDNVQVSHTGFWDILLDFIYKQGPVLVFWLEVFYLTVAYLTEIYAILLLVLLLIILQGEV